VIEAHLDLGGWPVVVADTAGLRETGDEIELEGVRRARARAAAADLRVLVLDATTDWRAAGDMLVGLEDGWDTGRDLVVVNKTDLAAVDSDDVLALSTKSGAGVPDLLAALEARAADLMQARAAPPLTRERHRAALLEAHAALGRSMAAPEVAMAAEDVRLAMRALGRITGTVRVDELLDVIFRDFCIGK